MFTDTLNEAAQGCISLTPLRMIQSLTLKGKEQSKNKDRGKEVPSYRNLLLSLVRLVHADPMLMLNVRILNSLMRVYENVKIIWICLTFSEPSKSMSQNSKFHFRAYKWLVFTWSSRTDARCCTWSNGCSTGTPSSGQVKAWNPQAPMNTFWDISYQILFSISQKLFQHHIVNYPDILKWLREIFIRRNAFLSQNKHYSNFGSQLPICKQARTKLEVVFFMYLWSIDIEAVLVAMSRFLIKLVYLRVWFTFNYWPCNGQCGYTEGAWSGELKKKLNSSIWYFLKLF